MKKKALFLLALILCLPVTVHAAEVDGMDDVVFKIYDTDGGYLTSRAGQVYAEDEYIASDNRLFIVRAVDDQALTAQAEYVGYEPENDQAAFALIDSARAEAKKLINMYSTHSDESYEPSDGTSSKHSDAGIYDVGDALKKNLEEKGITVNYSKDTFHPHDAGAYRRSRSTAEELLKDQPAALLDLHRDGIPDPSEYEHEVDGEEITKVRLEVGRSNPNASSNRAFAKQIKATADEKYPGLIKDIFIGKGNYNQELYPKAMLVELGTHTTSKEDAIKSTEYLADVLSETLFGATAQAAGTVQENNQAGGTGIAWIIGIAVVAAIIYALSATGSFKGMGTKLARGTSEVTGGLVGKKPKDKDKDKL